MPLTTSEPRCDKLMSDQSAVDHLMDSKAEYNSDLGAAYQGDSHELLEELPDNSIDLIVTSPPFALQHQKEYGNKVQDDYNDWILSFIPEVRRVLQPHGSFVMEIGGAFKRGWPERSTHPYELMTRLVDEEEGQLKLAQDFYWHNPAKLPNPIEWVNVKKIRVTDAVTQIWWFAPEIDKVSAMNEDEQSHPEASNQRVLREYSDSQKNLIKTGEYNHGERSSGWNINETSFANENGGAIPDNLISASNTASNTHYLKMCRKYDVDGHPARFPRQIPEFFVEYLTPSPPYQDQKESTLGQPVVLDIFSGSNITGKVAESLGRSWMSFEIEQKYIDSSQFRFLTEEEIEKRYNDNQSDFGDFASLRDE